MVSDSVLMVFVKNPVPGKVKTRLAEEVGPGEALAIYHRLLRYTREIVGILNTAIQIWYSGFVPREDHWDEIVNRKELQQGDDLGERMEYAFDTVFKEGYARAVIIGSDCAELTPGILEQAFQALDQADLVVGPSKDGGYYLLGMKELHSPLFRHKDWSTPGLYGQTMDEIEEASLTCSVLPVLNDVDTLEDWVRVRDHLNNGRQT